MTETVYNRLFSVRLVHDFYAKGFCNQDFDVVPWGETAQLMSDHKLLLKKDATGFRVYYKGNSADAVSEVALNNITLRFALRLTNTASFLNITALNKDTREYKAGKLIYFTNKAAVTTTALSSELIEYVRPKIFSYPLSADLLAQGLGVIVNVLNQSNSNVTPGGPDQLVETANYEADLSALPEGVYTFHTEDGGYSFTLDEKLLIDEKLAAQSFEQQGFFALIDIKVNNSLDASFPATPGSPGTPAITEPRIYDAQFSRRTGKWRYYLIMKTGHYNTGQTFKVEDTGADQSPYTAGGNELLFTTSGTPTKIGGLDAVVVNSNRTDIPFHEAPKKQISLVLDPAGTPSTIKTNLPGPATSSVSKSPTDPNISEIFIYI